MDSAIWAKNLVKKYKSAKVNAVDGIDLDVRPGEIYGFLGPNGAGKSTAIKVFVTTLFPTSGEVLVNGIDVNRDPKKIRESIGVVYQNPSLDKNLSAEENLRSHAVLYNLTPFAFSYKTSSQLYRDRLDFVLDLVDLKDKKFDIVKTYSGGMKRRLDIAKALMHLPKILFLDEPTTGLDPQSRKSIWEYLTKLQKQNGFTIFLTTQYLEEAEICNRISIIDQGKILVTDTPLNLKKKAGNEMLYLTPVDKSDLGNELRLLNIDFTVDDAGEYIIKLDTDQKAQSIIQNIKSELTEINIKRPTLDDVFIQMTGRKINN